jgi:hypothetical protein
MNFITITITVTILIRILIPNLHIMHIGYDATVDYDPYECPTGQQLSYETEDSIEGLTAAEVHKHTHTHTQN